MGLKNLNLANRIFNNTLALTIASAGQLVGNIILFFYLSRLLQAEGLGIYSTVIAIFHTVILGCAVVNPYIPRELSKDLSQTNRYLIHGGLISAAIALILTIGLDLLVPFLGYLPQTEIGLYLISLAIFPEAMNVVLFTMFISHQKAKFISFTSLVVIFGRILISLLALYLGYGVTSLIIIYAGFSYLSLLLNFIFLRRFILAPRWEFNFPFLTKMVLELKYFAGTTILNMLFSQSEVIVLSLIGGETQVGFYSAALKLVTVWAMLPTSYATAIFPVLSSTYQESRSRAVDLQNRSLKYLMALAFPLAVGICLTASLIIPLFYGPGFEGSIFTLQLLAWYLPLAFCNMILYRMLYVRGEQHIVFRIQFASEIIQVVSAVVLIPIYDWNGAAIALILGNFSYSVLSIFFVARDKSPLPLLQISWRFILASSLMGAYVWICTPVLNLFFLIAGAVVIYLALLLILRAFSNEDRLLFKRLLSFSKDSPPGQPSTVVFDIKE
ncbi:MAG: flippase [Anaerolineae bacterium]|nr:flippase [Anaerolineae bacterium]